MAEHLQETKPPEPPPKPPEVPKPTEHSSRAADKDHDQPDESQHSAQQDARDAAQSEHAKAMNGRQPEGPRATPEVPDRLDTQPPAAKDERTAPAPQDSKDTQRPQDSALAQRSQDESGAGQGLRDGSTAATGGDRDAQPPAGEQVGEHAAVRQAAAAETARAVEDMSMPGESAGSSSVQDRAPQQVTNSPGPAGNVDTGPERRHHEARPLDPADDLREQSTTRPEENTETDVTVDTGARLSELRDEGHGPQRHHDPTDEQLADRMGEPIIDPQTDRPALKPNGHVMAENYVDPMTGTTVDAVTGDAHRCGDYATRFDSAEDYVAAERFMRARVPASGSAVVRAPISEALGPDGHERLTGCYHDPAAPGELKPVDFTGGNVVAVYKRDENGELSLYTMYPDPVPFHPNQPGGTEQ